MSLEIGEEGKGCVDELRAGGAVADAEVVLCALFEEVGEGLDVAALRGEEVDARGVTIELVDGPHGALEVVSDEVLEAAGLVELIASGGHARRFVEDEQVLIAGDEVRDGHDVSLKLRCGASDSLKLSHGRTSSLI